MQILKYFDVERQTQFIIYRLKQVEWNNFLNTLPQEFRLCYIEDSDLEEKALINGVSKSTFLETFILPDDGKIKSGDFGEMLSLFAIMEHLDGKGIKAFAPRKWRWKDRNKAAQYSDAILFNINDLDKPSTSDLLVTLESKMKATASKEHRIQDAIDGANDDVKSRMVKTLNWLVERYARLGDITSKRIAERFRDPATYGTFEKKQKAVAILDSNFEADEISKTIENANGIGVIVFSISNLQQAYEQTRINIINSV